jgi:hypothetical protein
VRKVFEAEVLGLDFDRDSTSEGRARLVAGLEFASFKFISGVNDFNHLKPTNTAEDIIKLQERLFPRWLHDAVAEATYPRVRLGVTVR